MFKFIKSFLAIILPNHCLLCNKIIDEEGLFCEEDWKELQFITNPKCKICSQPFSFSVVDDKELVCGACLQEKPAFDSVVTIFRYNEKLKKVIGDLKYRDASFLANKLGKVLENKAINEIKSANLLVAVPLHKERLRARKFNQAVLIAKYLCKNNKNLLFFADLLIRQKHTKSQTFLKQKERKVNLKTAFVINEKYKNIVKGKSVLLVDDVITTGATLQNCAKILKKFGAKKIVVLTLAKTILE